MGQMISRIGQTDQWQSVQGLARDRQQWRLLVHEMISDQWRSQKFSMEGVRVEVL